MHADGRGDLGFMESIIAMMAVVAVTAAFLGVVVSQGVHLQDPADLLDEDEFTGTVVDERFEPGFLDYMGVCIDTRGFDGMSVAVTVPGGFCGPVETVTMGDMDGRLSSRSFTSLVDCDGGRRVTAVFEVTVCVRAGTGSWR